MKKILGIGFAVVMMFALITGCATTTVDETPSPSTGMTGTITVITREDGSGTRGAFIDLMDIKTDEGDMTYDMAEIANGTNLVMTTVQGNMKAIGYISLGSLNNTVKAVTVDGVEATADNISAGTYAIARPFNIASLNGEFTEVAQDFINFIMSEDGQKFATENGYISDSNTGAYTGGGMSGKVVCAGSTSVSPLMEKIAEAYQLVNPDVDIEIQATGSSSGMTAAIDGICDIGMASRELKDSEIEKGLVPLVIAMDGIAVVVNNDNSVDNLTSEQITAIYIGETTDWSDLG